MRHTWTFDYTASKLLEGAKTKLDYHTQRLQFWSDKKKEVIAKIPSTGIEIKDSLSDIPSNALVTGKPMVVIDPSVQKDLEEIQHKIGEHSNRVREFKSWIQILSANPEARLPLGRDDYDYFFGN